MLKHDSRIAPFPKRFPERLSEGAGTVRPCLPVGMARIGHPAPMIEVLPVDDANGAMIEAELAFCLVGDHGHGLAAEGGSDLQRHCAEAAGGTPDQHRIALFQNV